MGGPKIAKVSRKRNKYELEEPADHEDDHKNAEDVEYVHAKHKKSKGPKIAKVSRKRNKYELEEAADHEDDTSERSKAKQDNKLAKASNKRRGYNPEDYSESDESEDSGESEDPSEENFESVTMKQIRDLHKRFDADG